MVSAEDAICIHRYLDTHAIMVWMVGGWGIDALLEKQSRTHKDLDMLMLLDDVRRMCAILQDDGFMLKEIWSENRWAIDGRGLQTLTAFVLIDARGRELDLHAMRLDELGNGIPCWETEPGFIFTREDLRAVGRISGLPVRCITPDKQVLCHTGYQLPEKQVPDLLQLQAKFGVELPREHSRLSLSGKSG